MAITLDQVQQKQWDTYNKRSASLSDRLAEIEAYGKAVNPLVVADTAAVKRVAGERPIDVRTSQLIAGNETVNAQKSLSSDIANNDQLLTNLTTTMTSQKNNEMDNITALKKLLGLDLSGTDEATIAQKFSGLPTSIGKELEGLTNAVVQMDDIEKRFKTLYPGGVTDANSLTMGVTGPLASQGITALFTPENVDQLRQAIGAMSDERRKEIFGSAFTKIEREVGAIPGKEKQEAENIRIVGVLKKKSLDALVSSLQNQGFSKEQIAGYLAMKGVDYQPTGSSKSTSSSTDTTTIMTNPDDGKQYEVPASEVAEAKKNGWR